MAGIILFRNCVFCCQVGVDVVRHTYRLTENLRAPLSGTGSEGLGDFSMVAGGVSAHKCTSALSGTAVCGLFCLFAVVVVLGAVTVAAKCLLYMVTAHHMETSSLLAANALVKKGGSAVPARDGDILTVGGKRVRFAERLFQAGFTGNRIGGFHGTSLQSNMKCDVYVCKELYAASRRLVASSFGQASNGSLCPSSSFLHGLQADFQICVTLRAIGSSRCHVPSRTMRGKVAH